jgi:hypothetical protein
MSLWSPFFSQSQERFRLAELLAAEGREEEAIPWYRSFGHQSLFDMVHTGPSLLRLAGIHRRLGESHAAAAHCTRLLRLWEGSEPSFGEQVAAARRMLQELSGPGA